GIYYLGWQEATSIQGANRSVFNVDISRDGRTWERKYRFETPQSFQYPAFHEHEGAIWLCVTQGDTDPSRKERIMFGKLEDLPKPAVKVTQELLNSIHITPKLIFDPMPAYGQKYLPFAMAASMEATSKGRLWTCWAGGQDGPNAYLLASYSDDQGKSWRDPVFVIDPQAHGLKMGTRLGSFWCDPKGRLWLFFHQSVGMFDGSCSNWFVHCDDPDAEKPVWTQPVYIGFGASLNKPIVRKNGEWILPVSLWERWHIDKPFADCYHELDAVRGSNVFVSDDEGDHWRYRGGIIYKESCFNEHTVAELNDGRLWMLSRGMKETFQSFSADGGKTWQPQSTAFPHVNSKAVIRRLQSGHLLVIRHGHDMTKATDGRKELTAFLSTDDGKTWSGKLLLDERDNVSYPDIAQAPNGDIYIHYDRERTGSAEILFARFREEDVQAGKLISKNAALKNLVKSKLGMNHGSSGK
ncbi:sialidase family protein, partial [Prosthecobacter sp.]